MDGKSFKCSFRSQSLSCDRTRPSYVNSNFFNYRKIRLGCIFNGMLRLIAIEALWWEWTFVSCILDLPRSRAQNFLKRKARAGNLLCFRWQSERESAGAYYRNRKREAKDFEKVVVVSKHMTKFCKVLFDRVTGRFVKNLFSRLVNCFTYLAKCFSCLCASFSWSDRNLCAISLLEFVSKRPVSLDSNQCIVISW